MDTKPFFSSLSGHDRHAPAIVITRVADRQWHALDDDLVVGRGDAEYRPDGRLFVSIAAWHEAAFDRLAEAMLAELPSPVHTVVDGDTLFALSTGIAACLALLMVNDRPFSAGGFTLEPAALREIAVAD